MTTKTTTDVSRKGKTVRHWRNAWGQSQGIQSGPTSEAKDGKMARKWSIKRSTTGQGNPRVGTYDSTTGRKTKYYTGGGF